MLQKSVHSRVVIVFLSLMLLTGLLAGSAGAAPEAISRVTISDVRDVSFVVSWVTDTASNGTVTWGTSKPPGTAVADGVSSITTHYVQISGLSPNTIYYFQVSSGGDVDNNGGNFYQVTTGASLFNTPSNTIFGTVYQSNGTTVVPYAIVYLQLQDVDHLGSPGSSQLVSARSNTSGVWNYSLSNVRTSNFQAYFNFTPGADNLRLIGQGGILGTEGLDPSPFIIPIPVLDPSQQDLILNQTPTAVALASFSGTSNPRNVLLDWATGNEVDLLGFNVYRSENQGGVKHKLNTSLIQAQTPGSLTGNPYQFQDGTVESGRIYYYWIELVMQDENQEYGPVSLLAPYWIWLPMMKH